MAESRDPNSIALHYIDKLHVLLIATGQAINRAFLIQFALCTLVVALSVRQLEVDTEVSVGGLKLFASETVLMLALSLAIAGLYCYLISMVIHASRLRTAIMALYDSMEYSRQIRSDLFAHPLEYPDFGTVISDIDLGRSPVGRTIKVAVAFTVTVILAFAPLVTQIIELRFLLALHGPMWLITAYFASILAVMICYMIAFIVGVMRLNRQARMSTAD